MICVQGYKAFELVEASTDINEIALCKLCHEFVTLFGDARKHWLPTVFGDGLQHLHHQFKSGWRLSKTLG